MSEWKPGTVAVATVRGIEGVRVFRYHSGGEVYHWGSGYRIAGTAVHRDAVVADVRRLVVIDPEDREQVERLTSLLSWALHPMDSAQLAAALREFANPTPPKPPEPTGDGAVVEDAEGARWVRNPDVLVICKWRGPDRRWFTYDRIDAVRVLSEGVQP